MKWHSRKSRLRRWIDRHREDSYTGSTQVVLPLFPRKIGHGEGAPIYFLEPVYRVRTSTSWESQGFFDPGYSIWWDYQDPNGKSLWKKWWKTRPMHHLAGLVWFVVYLSPLWVFLGLYVWVWIIIIGG